MDASILFAPEGHENYHVSHYETHLDTVPSQFQHIGGVWLEGMSVCFVDCCAEDHQVNCAAECKWAVDDITARSSRDYLYVPSACLEDPGMRLALHIFIHA